MADTRKHVVISGHVQGVFFRSTAEDKARSCGVSGWITNRPDGTVEAVFEGDETAVDEMTDWCRKGPPDAHVADVQVSTQPVEGLNGFEVR